MSGIPADLKSFYPYPKNYKKTAITSVEAPGFSAVPGETIPRRNVKCKNGLVTTPNPSIKTVHDVILYSAKKYGNAKAVGTRSLIKMHTEKKKVKKVVDGKESFVDKEWQYAELSPYDYMSFVEFEQTAMQIGAGLRKLGLEPGDKLHLFASTQYAYPVVCYHR
jgi:long-chain acyl-CoA synthetase